MTPQAAFALLTLGIHHGDEIPSGADGEWMALIQRSGGWQLESAAVQIEAIPDPVLDEPGEPPTGKAVGVPDLGGAPLVLLRGPGLAAGPVHVAQIDPRPLFPGDQQQLSLPGGEPLTIQSYGQASPNQHGALVLGDYRLVVRRARAPEVELFPSSHLDKEGQVPRVLFAGDLDRDDQLDLLVDTSDHYNVSQLTLFLSSAAKGGAALAPVASFRTLGG
ncbi:MAG TPA: hypothetical protein ENK18_21050 [Deltaproteobacteria bacterium]|nr:hypothetical protein [Deltaproteobacteria bacterium]